MDVDEPAAPQPEDGPPLPPGGEDAWFASAEDYRHRQVWEEAIRHYRFVLLKSPRRAEALFGLALSYEAKAREPGYESYLSAAAGEYRKIIGIDPAIGKAHDGLLAVSAKLGQLDGLMEEYKARIARGGEITPFKDAFRKIQAMLIMQASPARKPPPPVPGFISILFGWVTPGVGFLAAAAAVFVRLKGSPDTSPIVAAGLGKLSLMSFMLFLGYKLYVYWRSR